MKKALSCGFVIIDKDSRKILACHPSGKKFFKGNWDIPKGHLENGETPLECAKRELKEETGLELHGENIYDVGQFVYTSYKDLHVFVTEMNNLDTKSMNCTTYFNVNGRQIKEVNSYELVTDIDYFFPKLRPIVSKALQIMTKMTQNNIYAESLQNSLF